jgi:hypothetical protein
MAEGFSFDNLYVAAVGRWVINKKKIAGDEERRKGAKEFEVRTCRATEILYPARKSERSHRIHLGTALEPDGQYWLNHGARTVILTCAKEKHADMVDCLGCRQLKGGFCFVDLLEIRLQ